MGKVGETMSDYFCTHCGEKIDPISQSPIDDGNVVWCLPCVETDGHLIEKASGYLGIPCSKLLDIAKMDGYVCWEANLNVVAICTIPKRVKKVVEAPKEIIPIKTINFCKRSYYGVDCSCPKCEGKGQVIPYKDVFGYTKEKVNEQTV
jgi:hypothetical protein